MQKIIISGCSGHMGRVVESLCAADPQVQVAAGFDILGSSDRDFPVFSSPAQFSGEADAAVEALLAGTLQYQPDVSCSHHSDGHGHDHACGSHGCGHGSCHS